MEDKPRLFSKLISGFIICLLHIPDALAGSCGDVSPVTFASLQYEPPGPAPHPEGTNVSTSCDRLYQVHPLSSRLRTCVNESWTGEPAHCRHVPRRCQANEYEIHRQGRECLETCRNSVTPCNGNKTCHCDGACGWRCIASGENGYCPEIIPGAGITVTYQPPERRFLGEAYLGCAAGYWYHSGRRSLTCTSSRTWSSPAGDEIKCIPDTICGSFPIVPNASPRATDKLFFLPGESHAYSCNPGYSIRGNRYVTCNADYIWEQPDFYCTPLYCGYPGDIPHATLTSRNFSFTARATYECHPGYEHPRYTLPYRVCEADRDWSDNMPSCQPIECPAIHSIDHGTVEAWNFQYESQITFSCDQGYRLEGSQRRRCEADKTWSGELTRCVEIICEALASPANGRQLAEVREAYGHNDVVYFVCDAGYTLDGSQSNRCKENSEWAYPVPICGGNCVVPEYPSNGYFSTATGRSVSHGVSLRLRCNSGFTARRSHLYCSNGSWSDDESVRPLCTGTPCDVRRRTSIQLDIQYNPRVPDEDLFRQVVPHGTQITYTCERGYRLPNGETENSDGLCWHGQYLYVEQVPTCQIVSCEDEQVAHGAYRYIGNNKPVHGSGRNLICHEGYRKESFSSSVCDDGQWINNGSETSQCNPKPCSEVLGENLDIQYSSNPQSNKYENGTTTQFTCHSGYSPAIGNGSAVCVASQWTPSIPSCVTDSNRAIGSETSQRQDREGFLGFSRLARDGITNGYYGNHSCSKMKKLQNPWWRAKMQEIYIVRSVKIYNRLDPENRDDIVGAVVKVGMDEHHENHFTCGGAITAQQVTDSSEANHGIRIECSGEGERGIIGRFVTVTIPTVGRQKKQLSLCEVEVYGDGPVSVNGEATSTSIQGCEVPAVENTVLNTQHATKQVVLVGDRVRFRCDEGFTLQDGTGNHWDIFCQEGGNFSAPLPVCVPVMCQARYLHHGGYPGNSARRFQHNETIEFSCHTGYEKEFTGVITCVHGQILPHQPVCVQGSCDTPDLPDHMTSANHRYSHFTRLVVSCETGFELVPQESTLPLCYRGRWQPNSNFDAVCSRVSCDPPGTTLHSTTVRLISNSPGQDQVYVHGDRVQYECIPGWEIEGDTERDCENGQWTGTEPECVPIGPRPCRLPSQPDISDYSVRGYLGGIFQEGAPIGQRIEVIVRCIDGYNAQPSVFTTCLNNSLWSTPVPVCVRQERMCDKPGYISHVRQFINGAETAGIFEDSRNQLPEGTYIIARCDNPGSYALHGDMRRDCVNGEWTGEEPSCEPVSTQLVFLNNQPLQYRSDGTIVIYPRSRLTIDCYVSFNNVADLVAEHVWRVLYWNVEQVFVGGYGVRRKRLTMDPPIERDSGSFTCRTRISDGVFSSHTVQVEIAAHDCEIPGIPTNGNRHDYGSSHGTTRYGEYPMTKEIYFTCNDNYRRIGPAVITCILGQWSHPIPQCVPARCSELSTPANGTKLGVGTAIGESVLFDCLPGFQIHGEMILDCQENGQWSHPLPTCHEIPVVVSPCASVHCEIWERCVIPDSNVAFCACINPHTCPPSESDQEVCGTDGQNYTSVCHLKAIACLSNTGVDVADDASVCIDGLGITPPEEEFEDGSQFSSSSWGSQDVPNLQGEATPDSVPVETPEAEEEPEEEEEPATVIPRSRTFCQNGECPISSVPDSCRNATAAVVVHTQYWYQSRGFLDVNVHEVIAGNLMSWTQGSTQQLVIDVDPPANRACFCPHFRPSEYYIIISSRSPTPSGQLPLADSDFVREYTDDLYAQVTYMVNNDCQEESEPVIPLGEESSSFSSSADAPTTPEPNEVHNFSSANESPTTDGDTAPTESDSSWFANPD